LTSLQQLLFVMNMCAHKHAVPFLLVAECWAMPHMIHIAVSAVSILIFMALAMAFSMAEIELNPVSKNIMGIAHSKWVEIWLVYN
jgi:hypothetical protein